MTRCRSRTVFLYRSPAFRCVALLLLSVVGCSQEKAEQPAPRVDSSEVYDLTFVPPEFPSDRKLDTILAVDLNGSGRLEYVVTSLGAVPWLPPGARADLIQIYQFDTVVRRYRIASADSIAWVSSYQLADLTGDRNPELISRLHSGGNDPVASEGMIIYSGDGGVLRPVFRSRRGMPAFVRIPGATAQGIILHAELWPLFATHADAVIYVDDLQAWRDGRYQSVRQERGDFFMKLADSTLASYRTLRASADSIPSSKPDDSTALLAVDSLGVSEGFQQEIELFNAAALSILYLQRAGAARSLLSFWSSEKTFLARYLPEIFFQELESIYTDEGRRADAQ